MRISGWVQCRLNGRLVAEGPNLVVAAGRALIAQIVESAGATKPSHMAIGDSSLAVNDSQTGLDNEIATRVALTDTVAGNEVTYSATFTAGAPQTVEEIGIFNASTLGTMLARFLSSTISMGTGNTLDVTWVLRFGD